MAEAGSGWGFAVMLLSGLSLALLVPSGILNDGTLPQLDTIMPGSGLLSPRSALSPVTFIIDGPPVDPP